MRKKNDFIENLSKEEFNVKRKVAKTIEKHLEGHTDKELELNMKELLKSLLLQQNEPCINNEDFY